MSKYNYVEFELDNKIIKINKYGKNSINELNDKILSYLYKIYGPYGFIYNDINSININGKILESQLISKSVNNFTIFKKFIIDYNINTGDEFLTEIEKRFGEIYYYDSDFFKNETYNILKKTSRKGVIGEKKCKNIFKMYAKSIGHDIELIEPTKDEDLRGIDAKFILNNKYYYLQVKPYISYAETDYKYYEIKSTGSLTIFNIDYLILYNKNNINSDVLICRNIKNNIVVVGNMFLSDKESTTIIKHSC